MEKKRLLEIIDNELETKLKNKSKKPKISKEEKKEEDVQFFKNSGFNFIIDENFFEPKLEEIESIPHEEFKKYDRSCKSY